MKVLIVGLGGIGQRHVRNLRAILGNAVSIGAVRHRGLKQLLSDQFQIVPNQDVEEHYGIVHYDDFDAALAERPDAVFVTNPTSLHIPIALAAAKAGCHLFIEKPLSHTLDGIAELTELSQRNRLTVLVGYQLRFHPCFKILAETIQKGQLGHIMSARIEVGEYLPAWHPYEDYRQMYASRRELGGGVILSQIHELDYAYRLFGLPKRVFALGGHLSRLEVDVEDTASMLLDCMVGGKSVAVYVHQDYVQLPPSRTCQVMGDRGKICVDFCEPSVSIYDEAGHLITDQRFPEFQRNQLFIDEIKHFVACLEGRELPEVSLHDGAQSLRIALAAHRSLSSGQPVSLDDAW